MPYLAECSTKVVRVVLLLGVGRCHTSMSAVVLNQIIGTTSTGGLVGGVEGSQQ